MHIEKYSTQYQKSVMDLIEEEGEDWRCYWAEDQRDKYIKALENSITYVAFEDDEACGYVRALDDMGFYIYVCDLLVTKRHRGKNIGRQLMEQYVRDYPGQTVYVMSDVDEYYLSLGYPIVGSVLEVTGRGQ
jgi:GNAT superfamily N-acetyltransferase